MKIVFDEEALDELQGIFAWIAKDDITAATALVNRIFGKIEKLAGSEFSRMGRFGRDPGTHELIEGAYIIVYEIDDRHGRVRVVSVVHGARDRG
jgi:toxin ParE1/3/4